ncbi:unnamed protein product [Prorocentrum cordatum]|uniref:Uncharacterized protein n=1 Tax=Prorocentrum cordatum TaxID=2364126 RepID=A0ABN9W8Z1_9DINO|nr:unnamed protein product [Polarella glacialis]
MVTGQFDASFEKHKCFSASAVAEGSAENIANHISQSSRKLSRIERELGDMRSALAKQQQQTDDLRHTVDDLQKELAAAVAGYDGEPDSSLLCINVSAPIAKQKLVDAFVPWLRDVCTQGEHEDKFLSSGTDDGPARN